MRHLIHVLATVLILLGLLACQPAQKALRSGHYDKALNKSVKKLRRKPLKEKFAFVLEQAFAKANERDLGRISFLNSEGNAERWVEILERYERIHHRNNLVRPLMPIKDKSGRELIFDLRNHNKEMIAAKRNAAAYLYDHALQLLKRNERGTARDAFAELRQVKDLFQNFKDVDAQLDRAKEQGTSRVIFTMRNDTRIPLPPDFERELTKISLTELNQQWLTYYTRRSRDVYYDYDIIVNMTVIDVGPEELKEIHYEESKEVEAGWQYVLDENGNVLKDTVGNDVKVLTYKTIIAYIVETQQKKVARISGSVDYFDNSTKQLIQTIPLTANAIFQNFSAVANGDLDALTPQSRQKLKHRVLPFPTDFELLLKAGKTLQPMVKDIIYNNKGLVSY